ncbi:reverse transcriptase domain-containing protein [Tanacetum coccineum]
MLRLQSLGSNTETGVPYTEEEIIAIIQKGKQRGHLPGVGRMLDQFQSSPEFGGASGSGGCGDDESGGDEDGDEDEEDEEDGDSWLDVIMQKGFLGSGGEGGHHKKKDGNKARNVSTSHPTKLDDTINVVSIVVDDHMVDSVNATCTDEGNVRNGVVPSITVASGNMQEENVGQSFELPHFNYTSWNGAAMAVPLESIRVVSKRNTWGKYGLLKSMLNSSTELFFFQFSSMHGLDSMLENGPWFIRNDPLIFKKWNPDVNLMKDDVVNVPVWVKIHGVPVTAFTKDGLSVIATKIGTPLMLDSHTSDMCIQSWGRSSYEECSKNPGLGMAKNLKKPSQAPRGIPVGSKVGFKPAKGYRPVSKKPTANTNVGYYRGTSNLASNGVNSSGSSFWNVETSSTSTTPIVDKIGKLEKLIINGNVTLLDDDGKPLKKVDYPGDHDSEDEVESVDNDMARSMASDGIGFGTKSLLEQ